MLGILKDGGTLVISDFQEPYELEKHVVVWDDSDIKYLLENVFAAGTSFEIKKAEKFPEEFGFYCCYATKPKLDENETKFNEFIQGYGKFLEVKKEKSKKKRDELQSQIEKRVKELISHSEIEIDTKKISNEEWRQILSNMEDVYGIKAQKIDLFNSQIMFLDDKIREFKKGI